MRQFKHIIFLPILFLAISCTREEPSVWSWFSKSQPAPGVGSVAEEKTDQYEIQYQFSNEVIRFEKDQAERYIIEVIDQEVIIDAMVPSGLRPSAGSILSAPISDTTPFGLGNRVLSIQEIDGKLHCETDVAALDEVFDVLELNACVPVIVCPDGILTDSEGNIYETTSASISENGELVIGDSKALLGSPNLICINFPIQTDSGFFLKGQVAFGAELIVDISLSRRYFEISLRLSFGVNASAGFQYEKVLKELWGDARRLTILPKATLVNGVVPFGPITLRPYVDIYGYVNLKFKGEGSVTFNKANSLQIGWRTGDGAFLEKDTTSKDGKFVTDFYLDGKLALVPEAEFDFGLGLWTKRIAAEMAPSVALEAGAELELTANENSWRLNPAFYIDLLAKGKGRVLIDFSKFLHLSKEMDFLEVNLIHWQWPLLPHYMDDSVQVQLRKEFSPLTFDATYSMSGGLMSYFGAIYPALRIYRGGDLVATYDDTEQIGPFTTYSPKFAISGLEHDISYTAKPSIRFGQRYFDLDGYPFSSTSPTAAITDIIQTGSDYGNFYHYGDYFDYEFYFYVNSYIIGSENCKEWGVYDPESVKVYNPEELKDGRVTTYWTGWSNSSYMSSTMTPYTILLDGTEKFYVSHTHTLTYGGGGPVTSSAAPYSVPYLCVPSTQGVCVRLDSCRIGNRLIVY